MEDDPLRELDSLFPDVTDPEAQLSIGELVDIVDQVVAIVESAKHIPLSRNIMLDPDAVLKRLRELAERLPEDLRAARWMIREREAFMARTNEKARERTDRARAKSEELVSDSYVLAEAVEEANVLVRDAEAEARGVRLQAEDLAHERLEHLEGLLTRMLREIREAREELHTARPPSPPPPV